MWTGLLRNETSLLVHNNLMKAKMNHDFRRYLVKRSMFSVLNVLSCDQFL